MPITTAFQLLGASLWGVFALGNWPGIANKMIGFVALIVILVGARMTVWSEKSEQEYSQNLRKAVVLLLVVKWILGLFSCTTSYRYRWIKSIFTTSYWYGNCSSHLCSNEYEQRECL